jgi:hypothetical protein
MPFVSECCQGERCHCGEPAEHKVEETIFHDDPIQSRHPLTAYICHKHFREIMGSFADNHDYRERTNYKAYTLKPTR